MKISPVGTESFHFEVQKYGQTDMTKLKIAFCNLSKAPKNQSNICKSPFVFM